MRTGRALRREHRRASALEKGRQQPCGMFATPRRDIEEPHGRFIQVDNLSVSTGDQRTDLMFACGQCSPLS
jgi:hypothetical protein